MSNYNTLKTTINANIKQNSNQEITGQILNSVLNQMVTTLGAGYQFGGVATTATNPGTPDAKVFYIANGKGTYTNFGGLEVTEDDVVVLYYDTEWHKVATGIASQTKLSELSAEVDEVKSRVISGKREISLTEDDFTIVGSITGTGELYPNNTSFKTTELIAVQTGDSVTTDLYSGYGGVLCAQYASDGKTLINKYLNTQQNKVTTFVIDENVFFVRFSYDITKPFSLLKYETYKTSDLEMLTEKVNQISPTDYYAEFYLSKNNHFFVNRNGNYISKATYKYNSGLIPLKRGRYILSVNTNCEVWLFNSVLFEYDYAQEGEYYSQLGVIEPTSDLSFEVTTPCFLVVNSSSSSLDDANLKIIVKGSIEGVEDYPQRTFSRLHVAGYDENNIYVYIPMKDGRYELVVLRKWSLSGYVMPHYGIEMCSITKNGFENVMVYKDYEFTRLSEYELAINLKSATHNNYIGGHMHGYEQMDSVVVKLDGKTINDFHFCNDCDTFEVIQYSTLYETDKATPIAKVTKRWLFDGEKFEVFLNVIFKKSVEIKQCQTAMFGVLRRLANNEYFTNKSMKDTSWQIVDTSDGWDVPATYSDGAEMLMSANNDATHLEQWGDVGFKVFLDVPKASRFENAGMFINTNGGTYNKMYYDCGSKTTEEGEYIFSHSIFTVFVE